MTIVNACKLCHKLFWLSFLTLFQYLNINEILCIVCCSHCHFFRVVSVFEQYQKSRTQFVQTVAELASRPQNIETLQNAGVMSLLRPLLLDIVPTIQQTAALALGRLANYNDDLAEAVVRGDILPQLVYSLAEQNVSGRVEPGIVVLGWVCCRLQVILKMSLGIV